MDKGELMVAHSKTPVGANPHVGGFVVNNSKLASRF